MYASQYDYPLVVKTGDDNDSTLVELYHLPDVSYARSIHGMELGAGYNEEIVEINDKPYSLYAYNRSSNGAIPVVDGDWSKFKIEKAPQDAY